MESATEIFSDEAIVVFLYQGTSSYTLITFGDLMDTKKTDTFIGARAAIKNGVSCIGIMPRLRNWFPKASIEACYLRVEQFLSKTSECILYGGSMGGYAALKFSKLFSASSIIAFCPQWSINPTDCGNFDQRFSRFFMEHMLDMSIKKDDTNGKAFLFVDPDFSQDMGHAELIRPLFSELEIIPVWAVDHHVTKVLAGSNNLISLIRLVREKDSTALMQFTNKIRRASSTRSEVLLRRSAGRHPVMVMNIAQSGKFDVNQINNPFRTFYSTLIRKLLKREGLSVAIGFADWIRVSSKIEDIPLRANILIKNSTPKPDGDMLVISSSGTMICYNIHSGELQQSSVLNEALFSDIVVPFRVSLEGELSSFYIQSDNYRLFANVHPSGSVSLSEIKNIEYCINSQLWTPDPSVRYFSRNGFYLSAAKDSKRVTFDKSSVGACERFRVWPLGLSTHQFPDLPA